MILDLAASPVCGLLEIHRNVNRGEELQLRIIALIWTTDSGTLIMERLEGLHSADVQVTQEDMTQRDHIKM